MSTFATVLEHAGLLCGTRASEPAQDMKAILISRLVKYDAACGRDVRDFAGASLESVQATTAEEAMNVVHQAQQLLPKESTVAQTSEATAPGSAIGARELVTLRTLLSIVFKWGVEPRYKRLLDSWPGKSTQPRATGIIDLTGAPENFVVLRSFLNRLLALVYPNGVMGAMEDTVITVTLTDQHMADLLRPCLALGWLPKSMVSASMPVADEIRPMVMRMLTSLASSQTIPALGGVLDSTIATPQHARKTCSSLLSRQLLRPDGLHGLYTAFFGAEDEEGDEAPLEKLEHMYRLLSSVPAHMTPEDYFAIIVPRLLSDMGANRSAQSKHVRASAFALSRMMSPDHDFRHRQQVEELVKQALHLPFAKQAPTSDANGTAPDTALLSLANFLANSDPSPTLISGLISPVVTALYAIWFALQEHKTSDPMLRDSAEGLLATWGRIINANEGIATLWDVVLNYDDTWAVNGLGQLSRSSARAPQGLSMFTPESLKKADETGETDVDSNIMDLRPDPKSFIAYIKSINRSDIASDMFVRLLQNYQALKADPESNPLRTLLYLQLVMQMQVQIPPGSGESDILKQPDHLLAFVKNALESASSKLHVVDSRPSQTRSSFGLADLRFVPGGEEGEIAHDSDDEDEDDGDEEMTTTAVNLLLSVLEIHPELSARGAPELNDIFELLEPLAFKSPSAIRALAREARLVITARLASTSADGEISGSRRNQEDDPQQIYQKALKLLQDPILPVRAHGLLLLRQLVTTRPSLSNSKSEPPSRALMPAILSIFRQSLQDEDSYIFLNAVQGLSAMVETYGKEVLTGILADYTEGLRGLGATGMTRTQVDVRVRIGEALGQVVRRCGSALGNYSSILIPQLFAVVRTSHWPAPLRVSSLSLLAQCVSTYVLAVIPYARDLAEAMVDLIQIEAPRPMPTPTAKAARSKSADDDESEDEEEEEVEPDRSGPTMDDNPTSINAKVPPIRRSALHFLSVLTLACGDNFSVSEVNGVFDDVLLRRMQITLRYVASTDPDPVVKIQARETLEGVMALQGFA